MTTAETKATTTTAKRSSVASPVPYTHRAMFLPVDAHPLCPPGYTWDTNRGLRGGLVVKKDSHEAKR